MNRFFHAPAPARSRRRVPSFAARVIIAAALRLLLVLPGMFGAGALFSSARAEDLQARFKQSLRTAAAIAKVEIKWHDTLTVVDPDVLQLMKAPRFSRTVEYSFTASGKRYRAACQLISSTSTNLDTLTEAAFDGRHFVTYDGKSRYFTTQSGNSRGSLCESIENPLTAAFMFLSTNSDDCLSCVLRSPQLVAGEFPGTLVLPPATMANGFLEFTLPGLALGRQPTSWQIDLDAAGDSFAPRVITHNVPGRKFAMVSRLLDYTNLGTYQFPSRIEWVMARFPLATPPHLLATGTVTVISARIPDHLDRSDFELAAEEKSAARVWDWDKQAVIKQPPAH